MDVMLGGIPIRLHNGPPQQEYDVLESGSTVVRRSGGAAVKMTHYTKAVIAISGSGWMGPGFEGLDFSEPLELRCTQQDSLTTTALTGTIPGTPRPDKAPWALAFIEGDWTLTPVAMAGLDFTITEVPGALQYQVCWMPLFTVFCRPPRRAMDPSNNTHTWSFTAEEV
ncbi:hypothetical protein D3C85_982920 [compost metagenome]